MRESLFVLSACKTFGPEELHPTMLRVLEGVMVKHTVGNLGGGVPKNGQYANCWVVDRYGTSF